MSLFWKKRTIQISLNTKDKKQFRYVYVDFEQKCKWYWLISENVSLYRCLKDCIQEWFLIWVNQSWMYEGENPNRLIDDKKLNLINAHINTWWNSEYQSEIKDGKIKNIKITHLIR